MTSTSSPLSASGPKRRTVLVGTTPADAARAGDLARLADDLGARLAFLQMASPSLGDVLDDLTAHGAGEIVLVGVSGGLGGPGVSWLRRIAAAWWADQESRPALSTATSFLGHPDEWEVLVASASPITSAGPGLTSAAWEEVPSHDRQVFICRGPRCTAAGAEESWRALVMEMMARGIGDDQVLVTQTGCQFPCNHAPVVTVQPDDVWYGSVTPAVAEAIVIDHLAGGVPVEAARLPRKPRSGAVGSASGSLL